MIPAAKQENQGACFPGYDGNIVAEIPQLTEAYMDLERGALKVTDVTPEEDPPIVPIFSGGMSSPYGYQLLPQSTGTCSGTAEY